MITKGEMNICEQGMVAHTYNPHTKESKAEHGASRNCNINQLGNNHSSDIKPTNRGCFHVKHVSIFQAYVSPIKGLAFLNLPLMISFSSRKKILRNRMGSRSIKLYYFTVLNPK